MPSHRHILSLPLLATLSVLAACGGPGQPEAADEDAYAPSPPNRAAFEATRAEASFDEESDELVVTIRTEPGAYVFLEHSMNLDGKLVFPGLGAGVYQRGDELVLRGRFGDLRDKRPIQLRFGINGPSGRTGTSVDVVPPGGSVTRFEPTSSVEKEKERDTFECSGWLTERGRPEQRLCDEARYFSVRPAEWVLPFALRAPTGKTIKVGATEASFANGEALVEVDLLRELATQPLSQVLSGSGEAELSLKVVVKHGRGESTGTLTLKTRKVADALRRVDKGAVLLPGEPERPPRRRTMLIDLAKGVYSQSLIGEPQSLADLDIVVLDRSQARVVGKCRYSDGSVYDQTVMDVRAVAYERRTGKKIGEKHIPAPRHPGCDAVLGAGDSVRGDSASPDAAWEWAFGLIEPPRPSTPPAPFALQGEVRLADPSDDIEPGWREGPRKADAVRAAWTALGLDPGHTIEAVIKKLGKPTRSRADAPFPEWRLEYPGLEVIFDGREGLVEAVQLEGKGVGLARKVAPVDALAGLVDRPLSAWFEALGHPTSGKARAGRIEPRWVMWSDTHTLMLTAQCDSEARCQSVSVRWIRKEAPAMAPAGEGDQDDALIEPPPGEPLPEDLSTLPPADLTKVLRFEGLALGTSVEGAKEQLGAGRKSPEADSGSDQYDFEGLYLIFRGGKLVFAMVHDPEPVEAARKKGVSTPGFDQVGRSAKEAAEALGRPTEVEGDELIYGDETRELRLTCMKSDGNRCNSASFAFR